MDERNGERQLIVERLYKPEDALSYLTEHIELETTTMGRSE